MLLIGLMGINFYIKAFFAMDHFDYASKSMFKRFL